MMFRTTKEIVKMEEDFDSFSEWKYEDFIKAKWVCVDDVKKEIEEIEKLLDMKYSNNEYMYKIEEKDTGLELLALLKFRLLKFRLGLCNSSEQNEVKSQEKRTAVPKAKSRGEGANPSTSDVSSVSCEHKVTGEEVSLMSDDISTSDGKSSPVQNLSWELSDRVKKDLSSRIKKCTCKKGKKIINHLKEEKFCCYCGGVL